MKDGNITATAQNSSAAFMKSSRVKSWSALPTMVCS